MSNVELNRDNSLLSFATINQLHINLVKWDPTQNSCSEVYQVQDHTQQGVRQVQGTLIKRSKTQTLTNTTIPCFQFPNHPFFDLQLHLFTCLQLQCQRVQASKSIPLQNAPLSWQGQLPTLTV